jgi:hypothetical protein
MNMKLMDTFYRDSLFRRAPLRTWLRVRSCLPVRFAFAAAIRRCRPPPVPRAGAEWGAGAAVPEDSGGGGGRGGGDWQRRMAVHGGAWRSMAEHGGAWTRTVNWAWSGNPAVPRSAARSGCSGSGATTFLSSVTSSELRRRCSRSGNDHSRI